MLHCGLPDFECCPGSRKPLARRLGSFRAFSSAKTEEEKAADAAQAEVMALLR